MRCSTDGRDFPQWLRDKQKGILGPSTSVRQGKYSQIVQNASESCL